MKPVLLAALAATALTPIAAVAGDTTVIHERYMEPGQPARVTGVTTGQVTTTTSHRTVVRRHVVRRAHYVATHRARHLARHSRYSTAVAGDDASRTTTTTTAVVAPPTPPTMVHRRTVIHRYDDGTVRRHTTVERQNPDGTVSTYEHRSKDVPPDDGPPMN